MRVRILYLICILANCTPSVAQEAKLRFSHLTTGDGLSQEDVHVILQDTLGFMWFGTEDGLNRYDGTSFRAFRPLAFDTTSLSHSWVVGLAEFDRATLLVATHGGGLNRYDA
ncbi:MAG: ligand-binding sensor domain-containing protein, partial [Bacteroidota bacterium]